MPLYDYQCGRCGRKFDGFGPMDKTNDHTLCPDCGIPATRLLSCFNFTGSYKAHDFKELQTPLGRKFNSTKEVDAFCKANNLERCDDIRPRPQTAKPVDYTGYTEGI